MVSALKSLSFAHSYSVVRSLCFLFWSKAFPALRVPPLRMMAVCLKWITTVSFSPSPNHMVPSLSQLVSVDNNTTHIFSFTCLRLVSNGCFCFVSVTGLGGSTLLSVSIRSFFCLASSFFAFLIYSPIAFAQIFLSHSLPAWRPRVGVNFPQPYRRQTFCEIVGIAAKYRLSGRLGPSQYNLFFEVSRGAGPSPPSNLSLEVMGTSLIRLDPTPFPWSSHAFAA